MKNASTSRPWCSLGIETLSPQGMWYAIGRGIEDAAEVQSWTQLANAESLGFAGMYRAGICPMSPSYRPHLLHRDRQYGLCVYRNHHISLELSALKCVCVNAVCIQVPCQLSRDGFNTSMRCAGSLTRPPRRSWTQAFWRTISEEA